MKNNKNYTNIIIVVLVIVIISLIYFLFINKGLNFVINDSKLEVKIGTLTKINYTINGNNKIEWTSNNDSFVVNENGEILANDYGNAIITGMVNNNDETITRTCMVSSYSGEIGVNLQSINMPEGYVIMMPNSEMEIPYTITPNNAYISSIKYYGYDKNIVEISGSKIISKNPGNTSFRASINNNTIILGTDIVVSDDIRENKIVNEIEEITLNESDITMELGNTKKISYNVTPPGSRVDNIEWVSSDPNVVSVTDGEIKALSTGTSVIWVYINGKKSNDILVTVKCSRADIVVDYHPKTLLRIGGQTKIRAHISPEGVNEPIEYTSSNPGVATVSDGVVTGVSGGTTTITLALSNGKKKTYTVNVLQSNGYISGAGNFWGYQSLNAKVPVRANISFFQGLSQNGIGMTQGNSYIITDSGATYTYDVSGSMLKVANKNIKVRIYYPPNTDLSITNTLVYLGGRGETNFGGAFVDIEKDPSMIKSAGIVAVIAEGSSFDGESGAYVTKFLRAITKQQSGVKNSLLGFSDGAHQVLDGDKFFQYDTLVVFSGYVDYISTVPSAKNSEIIFVIAANDGNYRGVKTAINQMKNNGFKNVMAVTNATDLGVYESTFLLHINPGKLMKFGHFTENIFNSKIIEYLND